MNDERILQKISKVKRNLMVLALCLVSVSVLLNTFSYAFFSPQNALPFVMILVIGAALLFGRLIEKSVEVKDEYIIEQKATFYRRSFDVLALAFIGTHFVMAYSMLARGIADSTSVLPLIFLIGLVMFIWTSHKEKFHYHYKSLYREHVSFRVHVLINVLKLIGLGLVYLGIVSIVALFTHGFGLVWMAVALAIAMTVGIGLVYYLLLALYEYIDYHEMVKADRGVAPIVSKNTLIFAGIILIFTVVFSLVGYLYYYEIMQQDVFDPRNPYYLSYTYLSFLHADISLIRFLMVSVVYFSLKRLPFMNKSKMKKIFVWVVISYSIIFVSYLIRAGQIIAVNNLSVLVSLTLISAWTALAAYIINVVVAVRIWVQTKKMTNYGMPGKRWVQSFLILLLFPIPVMIATNMVTGTGGTQTQFFYEFVTNATLQLMMTIIMIVALVKLSFNHVAIESETL